MGWDGAGNVVRTNGTNTGTTVWQQDLAADVKIRADLHDTHDQDLADSIERTLNLDGENVMAADLDLGGNRITNGGEATARDQYPTWEQTRKRLGATAQGIGTDTITGGFSPALASYEDKMTVMVRAAGANTTTTPTFNSDGLGAKTIVKHGNEPLNAGDIAGQYHILLLQFHAGNDVWELLNPAEIRGRFPNVNANVTATDEELNKLDGVTASTADINLLDTNYPWGAGDLAANSVDTSEIVAGAVGASEIATGGVGQAEVASNAVGRSELKTASGTVSVSAPSVPNTAIRILPGGQYGFAPEFDIFASGGDEHGAAIFGAGDAVYDTSSGTSPTFVATVENRSTNLDFAATVLLYAEGQLGTGGDVRARQRYIQASPPYNLGNGDIPLFVFAHMRSDGSVGGLYVAPDPPWANHGPTDIRPDVVRKDGRKFKRRRVCALSLDDVREGRADMADLIAARREGKTKLVEITQAMKQADMHLHPHSWVDEPGDGEIVLIDPCSALMGDLHALHQEGEDVAEILHGGHLKISSEGCGAHCPPRTRAVKARWR